MSHNTWLHWVARVGVRPLLGTSVTPNQITSLRLVAGVAAAGLLAVGEPALRYTGAALFLVSMLLDRVDGELARIGGQTSTRGHVYDLLSDAASNALAFVGIGVGLRHILGWPAIVMGVVAGTAVGGILWLVMRIEELRGHRAAEFKGGAGFDPDDAMLAVPVAAFVGVTDIVLMAAFVGAPAFAAYAYWCFRGAFWQSTE